MNASDNNSSTVTEQAFYTAFSSGDIDAMRDIWHDTKYVSCIHPMGDRLCGAPAVLKSWESILHNTGDVLINVSDRRIEIKGAMAIHTLVENIHLKDKPNQVFQFLATNIYELTPSGWKMILHHASPAPHDLSGGKSRSAIMH